MTCKTMGIWAAFIWACGMASAQTFQIVPGRATVDGALSPGEWDQANWIPLDKVYSGLPVDDLTNASYAALWDPSENVIYVAVTGTDTSHVLAAWSSWNGQDGVELYINANNDNTNNYYSTWFSAQQYVVGYDLASTSVWATIGGVFLPTNTLPAVAFGMVTNQLVYEFKLRPFDHYDYNQVENSTEVQLRSRLVIGLDVAMSSRTTWGTFGMVCEYPPTSKFTNAGNMRDHTLVSRPGVVFILY